jgi:hypothetical protein
MSMDFHKYAYCPKGASVVLHRSKELRRFQMFATSDWTGYTIINPTIQSAKSGGPMAAAWAVRGFRAQTHTHVIFMAMWEAAIWSTRTRKYGERQKKSDHLSAIKRVLLPGARARPIFRIAQQSLAWAFL